ncbi:MAG TPA: hypothetical protein VMY37_18815 [Thermoguttaceae bacterium]|nr:hypothetical protein [Thermoguttaceae bacterium]
MGCTTIRLLFGMAGLWGALFANTAVAALVFDDRPLAPTSGDMLLEAVAEEFLSSAVTCPASALPGPSPSDPPAEEEPPGIVRHAERLIPGGAAPSNSSSPSNGGSADSALAAAPYLPEIDPRGSVPPEAQPILPTGPPFELLRPC